jgi:hypothetical protein
MKIYKLDNQQKNGLWGHPSNIMSYRMPLNMNPYLEQLISAIIYKVATINKNHLLYIDSAAKLNTYHVFNVKFVDIYGKIQYLSFDTRFYLLDNNYLYEFDFIKDKQKYISRVKKLERIIK